MRRFLFVFACAFSFCVHSDTSVVELTDEQLEYLAWVHNQRIQVKNFLLNSDGSARLLTSSSSFFPNAYFLMTQNQANLAQLIHLLMTGDLSDGYDTSNNNILAYASSLRDHNAHVRESLADIEQATYGIWNTAVGLVPYFGGIWNTTKLFHSDYTNNCNRLYGNLDRLYEAVTNLDLSVSISNQIDLLQVMNGGISNNLESITNILDKIYRYFYDEISLPGQFQNVTDYIRWTHDELMDFLQGLTNGALFASNLCNCCSNSNYQDSVVAMLQWMTNSWSRNENAGSSGGDGSNNVWWAWRPDDDNWADLLIPAL